VRKSFVIYLLLAFVFVACGSKNGAQQGGGWTFAPPAGVALDTVLMDDMEMNNPFIRYEREDDCYYMVGDGGYMWVSSNLRSWVGPYDVLCQDTASWIGAEPVITSPEIHKFGGKYYYMATFERPDVMMPDAEGRPFARRSCVALVANDIRGPYRTIDRGSSLLVESEMAAHPTFGVDHLGASYMIYTHQGEQNGDGTVQIIRFSDDLGRRVGEAYIMFSADENQWSGSEVDGERRFSPVMEAPFLFVTDEKEMGILFTSYIGGEKAIGAAYTQTGEYGYNGPWTVEQQPLLTGGVGSASIFTDYDGTKVLVVGRDTVVDGVKKCRPQLFKLDMQFDKLKIEGHYKF
jgi:hypothetical protein